MGLIAAREAAAAHWYHGEEGLYRGRRHTCKGRLDSRAAVLCDGSSVGGHQGRCQAGLTERLGGGHSQRISVHCTHHPLH